MGLAAGWVWVAPHSTGGAAAAVLRTKNQDSGGHIYLQKPYTMHCTNK